MTSLSYFLTNQELGKILNRPQQELKDKFSEEDLVRLSGNRIGIKPEALRKFLSRRGVDFSPKTVAFINLKGGIGKTLSCITASTRAKQFGFNTCVVDIDAQASATVAFDALPSDSEPIFYDIWEKPEDRVMGSLKKIDDYLHMVPSALENSLLDIKLINPGAQKNAVRGVSQELHDNGFDLVMIDCPPSLSTPVISSICAADIIVIPVSGDPFSLRGLTLTLQEITSICDAFNLTPPRLYILFTRYDRREKTSVEAFKNLQTDYADILIPKPIRTSTEFSKALSHKSTVFASGRNNNARKDYDSFTRYLLNITDTLRGSSRK